MVVGAAKDHGAHHKRTKTHDDAAVSSEDDPVAHGASAVKTLLIENTTLFHEVKQGKSPRYAAPSQRYDAENLVFVKIHRQEIQQK
jgi:hypothetical protein